ncbi:PREDICTED: G-protein coupled receptor family C group 6 member A-like isoform X2 [Poecilia mexicana]|uniref:G-protein coupled receptor family C group 6 member A-like isoform X2 n=1 Tax=Poecilia mexicana TaxID=48701 RepID=UPI00072EBFA9|nr:PREDICTED: G-protein coupled receptor family C group 6 member A-like isoform X2 [Poecilia mexicana]
MFTKDTNVQIILEAVIEKNLNRTWIASDTWSTSSTISEIKGIKSIGPVFGFIFRQKEVPGFKDYVTSMFNGTTNNILSYYQVFTNGSKDDMKCNCKNKTADPSCLYCYIDHDESYNIYMAVQFIAEGLRILLKCNNQSCERTKFSAVEVSVFNCSRTCQPGQRMKSQNGKCCYKCVNCSSQEYSYGNDTSCKSCANHQFSPADHIYTCVNKTDEFLEWSDPFSIILITVAVIAIIATVAIAVIIRINRGTPIVKAIGGCLCFLEVVSLLLGFCVIFTFIGKPTPNSCVGIPVFGISFSIGISCILANLIQILVGFSFDPKVSSTIKKLNHPVAVVVIISGVQFGVSLAWLIVLPRSPVEVAKEFTILYQCNMSEESKKFFVATIVYNSFWGLVCFVFAFKGRQLPDIYKNASLITVSMVLFLITWIVFLPIYLTLEGKYKPAINSAAILISCISILGCHLAPKCYLCCSGKRLIIRMLSVNILGNIMRGRICP